MVVKLDTEAAGAIRLSWRGRLVWLAHDHRPYFVDSTSTEMTEAEVADFRREMGLDAHAEICRATGLEL